MSTVKANSPLPTDNGEYTSAFVSTTLCRVTSACRSMGLLSFCATVLSDARLVTGSMVAMKVMRKHLRQFIFLIVIEIHVGRQIVFEASTNLPGFRNECVTPRASL